MIGYRARKLRCVRCMNWYTSRRGRVGVGRGVAGISQEKKQMKEWEVGICMIRGNEKGLVVFYRKWRKKKYDVKGNGEICLKLAKGEYLSNDHVMLWKEENRKMTVYQDINLFKHIAIKKSGGCFNGNGEALVGWDQE